jgi:hypothetical protein
MNICSYGERLTRLPCHCQVIVVDVEDRDDSVWHNLTPIDGGLSGWHLLWDRWCPIPALRCRSAPFHSAAEMWPHAAAK